MTSLAFAPSGSPLKIIDTHISDEALRKHLENLGILKGQLVTPLSESEGDIILKVKESRLALNKSLAIKIYVE